MKFILVDKIESIEPGKGIVTTKALSLAEEYLADHFPAFPVLPGVMMIEAMVQSAAWLVRVEQDFAKSIVKLKAVRNARYANFVKPGDMMRCEIEAMSIDESGAKFKAAAYVGDAQTVSARLELESFNLADRDPKLAWADEKIIQQLKDNFKLAGGPEALEACKA